MGRGSKPITRGDLAMAAAAYGGAAYGYRNPEKVQAVLATIAGLIVAAILIFPIFALGIASMLLAYPLALCVAFWLLPFLVHRSKRPMAGGYGLLRWVAKVLITAASVPFLFVFLGIAGDLGSQTLIPAILLGTVLLVGVPLWLLKKQDRTLREALMRQQTNPLA